MYSTYGVTEHPLRSPSQYLELLRNVVVIFRTPYDAFDDFFFFYFFYREKSRDGFPRTRVVPLAGPVAVGTS
jgi:hypothetical protein